MRVRYEFESTGNKEIDILVHKFDEQIKNEYKRCGGQKELCPSYWNKLIFLEYINLDHLDWREIRSGKYWETKQNMKHPIQALQYTYDQIVKYKQKYL